MKPSAARAARSRTVRTGKQASSAGRGRKAARRVSLLAALAGGAFLAAYGLTKLHTAGGPPGMVWVPGGEFTMGSDAPYASRAEGPVHRVRVDGFWMDETDVTNAQFRAFVAATGFATTAEKPVDVAEMLKQSPPGTPGPDPEKLLPRCPGVPADARSGARPAGLLAVVALDAGGELAATGGTRQRHRGPGGSSRRPRLLARCRGLCEVGRETAAHRGPVGVRRPRRPGRPALRLG